MPGDSFDTFDSVRDRLDEIVEAVNAPDITLDAALELYEEAVKLGLAACDLSEEGAEELLAQDGPADQGDAASAEGAAGVAAAGTPEGQETGVQGGTSAADDAPASAARSPQAGASSVE